MYNEAETIGTLRFGVRAKKIKNRTKQNKKLDIGQLKILLDKAEKKVGFIR